MNGIFGLDKSRELTKFYPNFEQKNYSPLDEENFQSNDRQNKNVPEEVSKLFKNAKENSYAPISFDLFKKDDDTDAAGNTHGIVLNPGASTHKALGKKSSPAECETCANRKYQDGSDENDVSFQTPTHISPSIAASVVLGHEHEHVANAYEKERNGEGEVANVSVTLHNDICPECGRVFVAGGVTHTEMKHTHDDTKNPYAQEQNSETENKVRGAVVDLNL